MDKSFAKKYYFDARYKMFMTKVFPGEYFASKKPAGVMTILGSCVSVCLFDRKNKIGGMNHFMLPIKNDNAKDGLLEGRYGVYAMELLINKMMQLGSCKKDLEAKVFGGGKIMGFSSVGEKNSKFALEFLEKEGINVVAKDIGAEYSRKLVFMTETGQVKVRYVSSSDDDGESANTLEHTFDDGNGEVELFLNNDKNKDKGRKK